MFFVFTYHSIEMDGYAHSADPHIFESQIKILSRKYKCINLSQLEEILSRKHLTKSQNDYALVTFDDGVENIFTNAFPILKKYNIPATIFFTTSLMGKRVRNSYNIDYKYLNWQQLKKMEESGLISVECHGHNHLVLNSVNDTVAIEKEMLDCKNIIDEKLKKNTKYYAFPKGKSNELSQVIVKKYFKLAFAGEGIPNSNNFNKYCIPRIIVTRQMTMLKFKLATCSLFQNIKKYVFS
jgi:peptidoglycan/xylan/chitin deacetylase (PgdA/CDA1 family)